MSRHVHWLLVLNAMRVYVSRLGRNSPAQTQPCPRDALLLLLALLKKRLLLLHSSACSVSCVHEELYSSLVV